MPSSPHRRGANVLLQFGVAPPNSEHDSIADSTKFNNATNFRSDHVGSYKTKSKSESIKQRSDKVRSRNPISNDSINNYKHQFNRPANFPGSKSSHKMSAVSPFLNNNTLLDLDLIPVSVTPQASSLHNLSHTQSVIIQSQINNDINQQGHAHNPQSQNQNQSSEIVKGTLISDDIGGADYYDSVIESDSNGSVPVESLINHFELKSTGLQQQKGSIQKRSSRNANIETESKNESSISTANQQNSLYNKSQPKHSDQQTSSIQKAKKKSSSKVSSSIKKAPFNTNSATNIVLKFLESNMKSKIQTQKSASDSLTQTQNQIVQTSTDQNTNHNKNHNIMNSGKQLDYNSVVDVNNNNSDINSEFDSFSSHSFNVTKSSKDSTGINDESQSENLNNSLHELNQKNLNQSNLKQLSKDQIDDNLDDNIHQNSVSYSHSESENHSSHSDSLRGFNLSNSFKFIQSKQQIGSLNQESIQNQVDSAVNTSPTQIQQQISQNLESESCNFSHQKLKGLTKQKSGYELPHASTEQVKDFEHDNIDQQRIDSKTSDTSNSSQGSTTSDSLSNSKKRGKHTNAALRTTRKIGTGPDQSESFQLHQTVVPDLSDESLNAPVKASQSQVQDSELSLNLHEHTKIDHLNRNFNQDDLLADTPVAYSSTRNQSIADSKTGTTSTVPESDFLDESSKLYRPMAMPSLGPDAVSSSDQLLNQNQNLVSASFDNNSDQSKFTDSTKSMANQHSSDELDSESATHQDQDNLNQNCSNNSLYMNKQLPPLQPKFPSIEFSDTFLRIIQDRDANASVQKYRVPVPPGSKSGDELLFKAKDGRQISFTVPENAVRAKVKQDEKEVGSGSGPGTVDPEAITDSAQDSKDSNESTNTDSKFTSNLSQSQSRNRAKIKQKQVHVLLTVPRLQPINSQIVKMMQTNLKQLVREHDVAVHSARYQWYLDLRPNRTLETILPKIPELMQFRELVGVTTGKKNKT